MTENSITGPFGSKPHDHIEKQKIDIGAPLIINLNRLIAIFGGQNQKPQSNGHIGRRIF